MRAATTGSRRKTPVRMDDADARSRPGRPGESAAKATVRAEATIRLAGARVTQGRLQVLEVLQRSGRALTHHEIEQEVTAVSPLDRVTVYRVLDWLTREGIAHKVPGDDRVWRFTIAGQHASHRHAHFQCTDCSQVICLEEMPGRLRPRLPAGYRSVAVEVTVKGQCRECCRSEGRPVRAAGNALKARKARVSRVTQATRPIRGPGVNR